jgi:ATP adenylyltransferase
MEVQFTPWRMAYIKGDTAPTDGECVLCALHQADPTSDPANYLLYRGALCYVVLNKYPYNAAHMMVVPYQHTADLAGLDEATAAELFRLSRRCVAFLNEEYQPHGTNLGMNLGRTAGAGIAEHLHMHILPRWGGDTNFMPLLGGTKLVPEELATTYIRLQPYFGRLPAAAPPDA